MAKRGSRLHEFEKNNRVLDISSKQEARREKLRANREKRKEMEAAEGRETEETDAVESDEKPLQWKKLIIRAAVVIFIIMMVSTARNIYVLKEKEAELKNQNAKLLMLKEQLIEEEESIKSAAYIEKVARRDLQLAKSDDLIFYFVEEEEKDK